MTKFTTNPSEAAEAIGVAYKSLAKYYLALARARDHFERQVNMVRKLLADLPRPSRILDFACGTGDVLGMLAQDQECAHYLAGSDGSTSMLSLGIQNDNLKGIPLSRCNFSDLDRLFHQQGKFDLVYALGNSLAHTPTHDDLFKTLRAIYAGLNTGGKLAFDIRKWSHDEKEKCLVESKRDTGVKRSLGVFHVEDRAFEICDEVYYGTGRQFVTYHARPLDEAAPNVNEQITVSYLPFDSEEALSWLSQIGFTRCGLTDEIPDYPYLVIYGYKP